ncbi:MAG TPA: lysine 2,3-aminomutase [Firmicutes bacterium]|nr:lysine 2,3-aminomutase [Bacillota bacterium]
MAYTENQQFIVERINPQLNDSYWQDWRWQLKNSIRTVQAFEKVLNIRFEEDERSKIETITEKFPISITPYYLSLIDREHFREDPIYRQSFPNLLEANIAEYDLCDPLAEDKDSPVPGITHRYPDRVLFHVSNTCSMYCRHCTRKRKVGDLDYIPSREVIKSGLDYIRRSPEVRDVLLSGGDPLMLSDDYLEWILAEVRDIPHVEIIRIGTRMPVVLPYRITDELVTMLKRYQPVWINTHFNHPREITRSSKEAVRKLADGGFPLGNQSVLLAGVNDCPRIMKTLVHKLVHNRIRPYYLYQCDLSEGLSYFRTPVGKGIEIMENLIGHTSGFARPIYVIDAPGGGGKIPVLPNYILSWSTNKVVLRNYEGVITTYKEPDTYKNVSCNMECNDCRLPLNLDEAEETEAIGISRLLADYEEDISLVPANNERMNRRKNEQ